VTATLRGLSRDRCPWSQPVRRNRALAARSISGPTRSIYQGLLTNARP
jgi:hypothetical protein